MDPSPGSMFALDWTAWYALAVLVAIITVLVRNIVRPDLAMLGGLGLLMLARIVEPDVAFEGFSNSAVIAIAALFVVAAALERTNALAPIDKLLFQGHKSTGLSLLRLMMPTSLLSSFLNNTPIVAMFVPRVQRWANTHSTAESKYLIPLSYAAILGGMTTLIGTSTNVVVSGLMVDAGMEPMAMFDLAWVGIPAVIVIALFMAILGHRLLPDRKMSAEGDEGGLDDFLFEVKVQSRSPLIGRTVEEVGLRALEKAFLIHTLREGRILPASPGRLLRAGDVLTFVGDLGMLDVLLARTGLERVVEGPTVEEGRQIPLYEAVVAPGSRLEGKTLKETNFRETFGGVVLAILRRDETLHGSLGRIEIKAGDLLIVEAASGFDKTWNSNRNDFYLVASRSDPEPTPRSSKAPIAVAILAVMVAVVSFGLLSIVEASFLAALAMIATRCIRFSEARQSIDVSVLVVIAAALGIGKAIEATGLATTAATALTAQTELLGAVGLLIIIYFVTNVLTELITHKAAAVLMFPVSIGVAESVGANPKAFALVVAVAAAASFMTPIGYQTNLMVMSAGRYRYTDYLRAGIPVSLLVMAVAITMISIIWL